jgi:hypothetical protein
MEGRLQGRPFPLWWERAPLETTILLTLPFATMDPSRADQIVLVVSPGPEHLAALLLLAIGLAGLAVGIAMARRGRLEAWSLAGVFGLVIVCAAVALVHLPTRLVVDRTGVELAFWSLKDRRAWNEIRAVDVRQGRLGLWLRLADGRPDARWISLWSPRAGFFAAATVYQQRDLAMRLEAWRLAAGG